jgi:hypothetical protein
MEVGFIPVNVETSPFGDRGERIAQYIHAKENSEYA